MMNVADIERRISIGFVVYNPGKPFMDRINKLSEYGYSIYIFDNSPDNGIVKDLVNNRSEIHYYTCGKNFGLGVGLSTICAHAYDEDQCLLAYFDQDTVFSYDTLTDMKSFFVKNNSIINNYSAVVFNSVNTKYIADNNAFKCFIDIDLARSSGSVFILKNLKTINWHNKDYFVDGVDYEFCLNSRRHGFKIGAYSCAKGFDHTSEQVDSEYCLFGRTYLMRKYSRSRILDTMLSNFKIVIRSICYGEFAFGAKIFYLFIIYIVSQVYVRIFPPKCHSKIQ